MANVKITELVELAAADVASGDVFPIVDIGADATKKVTIATLRTTVAAANDFITYTLLNANVNTVQGNVTAALAAIDVVQDNVAAGVTESTAIEARRVANIAGAVSTITTADLTASKALVSDGSGKVAVSAVTSTELGYVDGVTSAIQTQLDTKIAITASAANDFVTFTRLDANIDVVSSNTAAVETKRVANIAGAVSTITTADLTASRAVVSDGSGKVAVSAVTSTELGYVDGVTSAIQTQINDINTRATANAASSDAADAVEVRRVANIAGAVSTITTGNLTASKAMVSDGSGKVAVSAVTATELGYVDGVTSAIQTQIDSKQATITGAATTIDDADLTASRAIVSDGSGKVAVSAVTATEIGYLDGVSSAIQTQINTTNTNLADNSSRVAATVTETTGVEARRVANIAGAISTITTGNLTASKALVSDGSGKVSASAVTATELGYVDGVTSAIQTQIDSKQATITGAATTIDDADLTASRALVSDGSGKVAVSAVTATEVGYLDGVSSAIQTQIDSKQATITGAATTIDDTNLTASRAVVSDGSGKVAVSVVTSTEIGYLDGVSSAIQTQLNTKAPLAGATFTGQVNMSDDLVVTGNLTVNGDTTTVNSENKIIQDRFIMLANAVSGAPSADVGIFFNRGTSGNAALYYDESAKFFTLSETRDPDSNIAISPTGAANLAVGQFTATSVKYNGADLNTAITDNRSGAVSTVYKDNLTASRAVVSDGSGKIAISAVTATEVGYLDGVSSAIQTQINSKQATITGAATTIDDADLTASRAVVSDGSGKIAISAVTSTEIGYLDGVSSAIQTQINTTNTNLADNSSRVAATVTETTAVEARRVANIAGAVSTITTGNLTASRAVVSDGSGKVAASAVTATELGYVDGVTSAIQTQIDSKQATITGAATTIDDADLTASRALVSDGSGKVAASAVTATELGYVDGVTSSIQTQLGSKAALAGATFSGTIQLNSTFVQGVNDQGYDFKLFGDTSGAFLLWDTSADTLGVTGAAKVDITKDKLLIGGTAVTTTAAEVNLLDAITRGSIIYGNASGASARLAVGGADKVLTTDGTDISWEDPAGGGAMGFTTATTIADPPGTVNTDLGNLTDTMFDDFGISQQPSYDLMEPHGRTVSLDLGAL